MGPWMIPTAGTHLSPSQPTSVPQAMPGSLISDPYEPKAHSCPSTHVSPPQAHGFLCPWPTPAYSYPSHPYHPCIPSTCLFPGPTPVYRPHVFPQTHSCPLGPLSSYKDHTYYPRPVPAQCPTQVPRTTSAQPQSPQVHATLALNSNPHFLAPSHIHTHTCAHAHTSTPLPLCTCCSPVSAFSTPPPYGPRTQNLQRAAPHTLLDG